MSKVFRSFSFFFLSLMYLFTSRSGMLAANSWSSTCLYIISPLVVIIFCISFSTLLSTNVMMTMTIIIIVFVCNGLCDKSRKTLYWHYSQKTKHQDAKWACFYFFLILLVLFFSQKIYFIVSFSPFLLFNYYLLYNNNRSQRLLM